MEPSASSTSKALAALIKEQQDQYRAARNGANQQGQVAFVRRADLEPSRVARASANAGSLSSSNGAPSGSGSALNNQHSKKRQRDSSHDNISSDELARQKRILLLRKQSRDAAGAAKEAAKERCAENRQAMDSSALPVSSLSDTQSSGSLVSPLSNSEKRVSLAVPSTTPPEGNADGSSQEHKRNTAKALPTSKDDVEREDEKTLGKNTRRIFKRYIDAWAEDLRNRSDKEKRSALGREESKRFKQCKDNIRPMFKLSRQGKLKEDLRMAIRLIAHYIHVGEYVKAHDQYILLAIGNAAWPIGVTMVGIHARGGRERIQSNKIAHAMDDELTLKYLTSIKRLISYAQRKYPSAPSKMVPLQRKIWVNQGAASWELVTYLPGHPNGTNSKVSPSLKKRKTAADLVKTASLARMGPMKTLTLSDGSILTVLESSTLLFNPSHEIPHDDITDLDDMHEASVLNLIRMRFLNGIVYTNIGNIVIAVNPYRPIANLYDIPCSTTKPHIFQISQRAYDALWEEKSNQVIIVNGESGAGKTESTKIVLRYLSWISSELEGSQNTEYVDNFELGFVQSSRVDKIGVSMNGLADAGGVGASNKVTNGGSDSDSDSDSDCNKESASPHPVNAAARGSIVEANELVLSSNAVCEAFGNAATIHNRNSSRFAILLLGNLEFSTSEEVDRHTSALESQANKKTQIAHLRCNTIDKKAHADLAHVLGLDPETVSMTLNKATTTRIMRTKRGSITEIPLTLASAEASRDGLAKFLYSALFDHIFERLNACGRMPKDKHGSMHSPTIGVLDIFGFEILPSNSFEQLCINYANESLQALYNDFVFSQELKQYEEEGVDCSNITYTDNRQLLSLLDGSKPVGIFRLVDETGMRGGEAASDSAFLANANAHYGNRSNPHPFFSRPRFGGSAFVVRHFAGDVTYCAAIILQKTYRGFLNQKQWIAVKIGVNEFQKVFRGYRIRKYVLPFIQIRRLWKHILEPNEVLLRVSYCAKFAGTGLSRLIGRKKRRLLFLTSAGRIIYFKHQSAKIKGEFLIDVNDPFGVNMIDDCLFECIAPNRKYKFFDLFRDSKGWAKTVKQFLIHLQLEKQEHMRRINDGAGSPSKKKIQVMKVQNKSKKHVLSLSSFMFSLEFDPTLAYLRQGLLLKCRAHHNRLGANEDMNYAWVSRWFILHGSILYWFKSNGEGKPRGKIVIGAKSKIVASAEHDFCFKLITPLFNEGILLAATSLRDKQVWTKSLNRIIARSKAGEANMQPKQFLHDTNKSWHARMVSMAPVRNSILSENSNLKNLSNASVQDEDVAARSSYAQDYEYGFDSDSDLDSDDGAHTRSVSNVGDAQGSAEKTHLRTRNLSLEHLSLDKKTSSPVLL
eukprot:g5414.t1